MKLDEIEPNERKSFVKKQEELQAHYYNFPDIEEIVNQNAPNVKKAEEFTQSILSQKPSGNVAEKTTACHVIYNMLKNENSECLFFDSKQGMKLHDASSNLNDLGDPDKSFVLKLKSSEGLGNLKYKVEGEEKLQLVKTLGGIISKNQSHPILDDVQERLANAHQTDKKNIFLQGVFDGSFNIVYEVLDTRQSDMKVLTELPKRLKKNFQQYETAKMHPLLCRPAFDISMFDEKGNKTFPNVRETHLVGPPGRQQTYTTPAGWTRYGLQVLNRFSDGNEWLEPFGNPRVWYRAFHGTGRASADDFKKSNQTFNDQTKQFASVDAMASIHKTGFRKARVHAYGEGVYCSPDPTFPEKGYVGEVQMNTEHGPKRYRCMMMVAVNPDGVIFTKIPEIWVVSESENIRPYGILIKEV